MAEVNWSYETLAEVSAFSTWSLVDLQDVKPLWSDFREDPGYHGRRTLEEAMRRVGFQIRYRRMHRGGIP